ncbi:hypothetical protein AHF37_08603 [Paragonimus kellicotti]|nr:hypothetical protein AHF37_08603 [Paragonimus kellicotti]
MGFGWPTMYCQLDMNLVGGQEQWDRAVYKANEVYKLRMPRHRNEAVDSHVKTMHSKHLDRVEIVGSSAAFPSIDSAVKPSWHRFPHSLVWTPIPLLTWLFPIVGHMGITNASGIIYDFAAPYTICEDNMGFGWPTMYCQLDMNLVGGQEQWDRAVYKANEVYKLRMVSDM